LTQIFGDTVQVRIIEALLSTTLEEQKNEEVIWHNFSDLAKITEVAKSSAKRILDELISAGFIEEKQYETHAQNPPRFIRLRADHPAIRELIFFFRKVRGFL
jgi:predicted transcriptional regulator